MEKQIRGTSEIMGDEVLRCSAQEGEITNERVVKAKIKQTSLSSLFFDETIRGYER